MKGQSYSNIFNVKRFMAFSLVLLSHCSFATFINAFHNPRYGVPMSFKGNDDSNLTWNDLELTLLNKINGLTLHSNNAFHVIRATFSGPQRSVPYQIHLTKTQDLFHSESLQISTFDVNTHYSCFYSGTITQLATSTNQAVSMKTGLASLSTCHHNMGFEGLLILPDGEHFYVRPSYPLPVLKQSPYTNGIYRLFSRDLENLPTLNEKQLVPHKANKLSLADGSSSEEHKHHQVVFKVAPTYKLQKSTERLEGHPQGNNLETNTNAFYGNGATLTQNKVPTKNDDADLTENSLVSQRNTRSLLPSALSLPATKSRGTRATPKKGVKKPQKGGSKASASNSGRVIDLAVFTDVNLYKTWTERYAGNAMKKINQYVMAMISQANTLYQQPSMKEKISFRLVHMEVQKKRPTYLNENNGAAVPYLTSFCDYAAERNQNGHLWDHALMLTGMDIADKGNANTVGIAWTGTMCSNSLSCSLSEASYLTPYTVAHEVGHSFHMDHDGDGRNSGCNREKYIMAAIAVPGQVDWSSCSRSNLKIFLSEGNGKHFRKPTCLTKKNGKDGVAFNNRMLPGQSISLKEQCAATCGDCIPKTTGGSPYNNMCFQLYCEQKIGTYNVVHGTPHPALEGSPCDNGKTCHVGKCQ